MRSKEKNLVSAGAGLLNSTITVTRTLANGDAVVMAFVLVKWTTESSLFEGLSFRLSVRSSHDSSSEEKKSLSELHCELFVCLFVCQLMRY